MYSIRVSEYCMHVRFIRLHFETSLAVVQGLADLCVVDARPDKVVAGRVPVRTWGASSKRLLLGMSIAMYECVSK